MIIRYERGRHSSLCQFWKGSWAVCVNPKIINQFLESDAYRAPSIAINPSGFEWDGPPHMDRNRGKK